MPPARRAIRSRWPRRPPRWDSSRSCPPAIAAFPNLGLIAGCGMLIAFLCSITLVPAMLALLNPPGEAAAVGFQSLAPLDHFLQRHRIAVIAGTILIVLAGTPLLLHLPFDFNPVNLQSPSSASVVTYRQLQRNPETSGNDAEILAPSLEQADAIAKRLAALPEVSRVLTLSSFIPGDQDRKIAALKAASQRLGAALNPQAQQPAPSDQEVVAAIQKHRRGPCQGCGQSDRLRRRRRATRFRSADASGRRRCRRPGQGGSRDRAAVDFRSRPASQQPCARKR